MNIVQQLRQLDYFKRHIYNILPYITIRKLYNLTLNFIDFKLKVSTPYSYPPFIKIEPTPLCHLRCPGCRHSDPVYNRELKGHMKISVDNVKKIIDPIADTLLGVSLSNHGEPLLNQDISKLIQYLHEKNIAVSFPTCLSVKMNDSEIERLVASGADTIAISLDGLSDETYSQYRILGKFDLVISNVKRLHDAKKKLGLKRPRLLWKYIIFEHNKHESQKVREEYRNLGFDDYEMVIDVNSAGYKSTRSKKLRKSCFWPWHTMMIDWDGKVAPCCTHSDFELGNAINSNTSDLWVSPQYISLREGFSDRSKLHPICKRCLGYSINL